MADETERETGDTPLTQDPAKVQRLLTWASLLAVIAVVVLVLDIQIKGQILHAAKDADAKLNGLGVQASGRANAAHRFAAGSQAGPDDGSRPGADHVDGVGHAASAPQAGTTDEVGAPGAVAVPPSGVDGGPERDGS